MNQRNQRSFFKHRLQSFQLSYWWQAVQQRPGVSINLGITVGRVEATASGWRVVDDQGNNVADADVVVLACREQALTLAGMQEADHGRLRLSAAQVWLARADGGPPDEDPGHQIGRAHV